MNKFACFYSMGDVADDLLSSTVKLDKLLEKFQNYFGCWKNPLTSRAKFNRRFQKSDEKIYFFLEDLHHLADDCEYGALKNDLLGVGVLCEQLLEKLVETLRLNWIQAPQLLWSRKVSSLVAPSARRLEIAMRRWKCVCHCSWVHWRCTVVWRQRN